MFAAARLQFEEEDAEAVPRGGTVRRDPCDHRGVQRALRERGQRPSQSCSQRRLRLQREGKRCTQRPRQKSFTAKNKQRIRFAVASSQRSFEDD